MFWTPSIDHCETFLKPFRLLPSRFLTRFWESCIYYFRNESNLVERYATNVRFQLRNTLVSTDHWTPAVISFSHCLTVRDTHFLFVISKLITLFQQRIQFLGFKNCLSQVADTEAPMQCNAARPTCKNAGHLTYFTTEIPWRMKVSWGLLGKPKVEIV